jgi:hypothetical protein
MEDRPTEVEGTKWTGFSRGMRDECERSIVTIHKVVSSELRFVKKASSSALMG